MKKVLLLLALSFSISCGSDDMGSINDGPPLGEFPETGVSGYNTDDLPSKETPLPNLLNDSGFENNEWFLCGDAAFVESPSAHSGNQMATLGNNAICEQASVPFFSTRNAILIKPLEVEELPALLTVSFWIKADTSLPDGALTVYLTNGQDRFLASLAGGDRLVSYFDAQKIGSEWLQIKLYYENDGDSIFISNSPPFSLAFELEVENGYTQPIRFYIDDVKVSAADETFTQPEPLPEGLLNYAGDSRILFFDNGDNTIASMEPNGQNVVAHDLISREFLNSIPQWYDKNNATASQKMFYPENPGDLEIVPASGTDLVLYDVLGNTSETIYQTIGDPGRFSFNGSEDNKEAIDIEVRRTNWDLARNRGALSICGRARTPSFVSDDLCTITILDTNDFSILNEELRGFNAVWSSQGQLAYYNDNGIYTATISGTTATSSLVYQGTGSNSIKQEVDWSPDGNSLVFAETIGGVTLVDGSLQNMFTISIIDIQNNTATPLLNVDQGRLGTNLSWSPDGNYILYTVYSSNTQSKLWWLEVATGKTGPLTTSLNAASGYWRK